ncbi:MAG: ABC transporter ATP-binding protein [Clostridiales bacterium]|nr:ABC transporter ATP-binding protein [Clostridiales bacterium]
MLKQLSKFTKGYRGYTVITPLLVMLEVSMEVTLPFIMSKIIDNGINGSGGTPYVVKMGLIMVAMAMFSLITGGFAGRTCSVAAVGFSTNLRNGLFSKVQDFSFSNTDKFTTAGLVTRLTTDVNNVQMAYMMLLRMLVRSPMMLICATAFAMRINFKLSIVFLVAIPVLGGAILTLGVIAYPRFIKMLKKYDLLNESVQENLAGIRVVKTFVRENHETEKFRQASDNLRKMHISAEKSLIKLMPIMMLVVYACILSVLYIGGGFITKGAMTTGELTSFLSYNMQILMSLLMLGFIFVMVVMSRASVSRVTEVLNEEIEITDDEANPSLTVKDGSIVFEKVNFAYAKDCENYVLKDVNLEIDSGQTVGIIGGTGASKTTLVQLIPRLYDATCGNVMVAGHNVKDYKLDVLRGAIGMVLQKNELFSGTIKENLKWGNNDATDKEIEDACKVACAYDFVINFPNKFDTVLEQGAVNISGGQKQRLSIARALLKKPKIMILDDSTSAVDTATDASIRKELKHNLKGMTTIIIAQRIASVIDADKIVVMDNGKIVAMGMHDQLLKTSKIYQEVYFSQTNTEVENV